MEHKDKLLWLKNHGMISRSGYFANATSLVWSPFNNHNDEYYFVGYAPTFKAAIAQIFEEAKETLFQDCRDIDGTTR